MSNSFTRYISSFGRGLWSLLKGMRRTIIIFFRKKTTECYPENRATLVISERFRGELVMPHDENNQHKCVACGICQEACPVPGKAVKAGQGKKARYDYHKCIRCYCCQEMCPAKAISVHRGLVNRLLSGN